MAWRVLEKRMSRSRSKCRRLPCSGQDLSVEGGFRLSFLLSPGEGEGHGRPDDEEKEGHDEIPEDQTIAPGDVLELVINSRLHPGELHEQYGHQRDDHGLAAGDPEHVEAAKGVDGDNAIRGVRFGSGRAHEDSFESTDFALY